MQDTENKENTEESFLGLDDIKSHLATWNTLLLDHIRVKRMGGLSNQIWKVESTKNDIKPSAIIYRKFGQGPAILDRERENYVLKELAEKKIAPTYYGGDEEYRVEKFVDSKMLTPSDLEDKENRRKLARLLADLHEMKFDKLEKKAAFAKHIKKEGPFIQDFKKKLREEGYSEEDKKKLKELSTMISKEELSFLQNIIPQGEDKVAFSHNDLHSQNVVSLAKNDKFMLIDYEYSDYNFRGYDIANIFNESMIEYDLKEPPHYKLDESNYPDDKYLLDFVKYYWFFRKFGNENFEVESILKHDSYRDEYVKEHYNQQQFDKEADQLLLEVQTCSIFTHWFWCIWGVIRSGDGAFEFDYVDYAYTRFRCYQKLKKQFEEKGVPHQQEKSPADI